MPKQAAILGPLAVRNLKAPGLHFVGEVPGLALQVLSTGAKTWILRATMPTTTDEGIIDKRRDMGLGGYPEISLADARTIAKQARQKIREGISPIEERKALVEERKALRSAERAAALKVTTFQTAAESYIASMGSEWKNDKHRAQWESTLKTYAYPTIGDLSVADIELPHILSVLEPIWSEKTETASRLRGRIEAVLNWSTTRGLRAGLNPARWRGHLDNQLAKPGKLIAAKHREKGGDGHHPAVDVDEAAAFAGCLRAADGMGARALEFATLTAARSGEVRGATWAEIDLEAAVWTVPGARMKAGKDHRVTLSKAAVALLRKVPQMAGTDLVFWAPRGGQLSDMTLSAALKRIHAADVASGGRGFVDPVSRRPAVPHGLRSTFRDWVSERTTYPGDMAEMALAHTISDKTRAAYQRGTMVEKRRRMMEDWAKFLASPKQAGGDNVVSIARNA